MFYVAVKFKNLQGNRERPIPSGKSQHIKQFTWDTISTAGVYRLPYCLEHW